MKSIHLQWWDILRNTNLQIKSVKDKGYYTNLYFGANQRMWQYLSDDEILAIFQKYAHPDFK